MTHTYYRFYIELHDGTEIEWLGLTRLKARQMYAYTDQTQPSNVKSYGWEQTK